MKRRIFQLGDSHRDGHEHDHHRAGASVVLAATIATGVGVASSSAINLAAVTPTRWIAQEATVGIPLTVEALDQNGAPQANVAINFLIEKGTVSLSAASASTNSSGFATVTASLTNLSADVLVSACVAPNNAPCQAFTLHSDVRSLWTLETVSGSSQIVLPGQAFQPLVMRVTTDSSGRESSAGSERRFCDHAGADRFRCRRNTRSPDRRKRRP